MGNTCDRLFLWERSLNNEDTTVSDTIIINEVQLLLAKKRTSLAAMRTGIALFALPLTIRSVLIATSKIRISFRLYTCLCRF